MQHCLFVLQFPRQTAYLDGYVVRLCGARREDDLLRVGADEQADLTSEIVYNSLSFLCSYIIRSKVATYRHMYRAEPKEPTQFGSVSGSEIHNMPCPLRGIVSLYRSEAKEPT